MNLKGRRIQIAGSAGADTGPAILKYGHELVRELVLSLAQRGALFLSDFGREPRSVAEQNGPAIIFYWTIAEALDKAVNDRVAVARSAQGQLLIALATTKTDAQVPDHRRALYVGLRDTGAVALDFLQPGWSSGALRRERQAQLGDILIAISGGEGIEHLAREYSRRGKPVIPLDLQLASSSGDGTGGAVRLFGEALTDTRPFFAVPSGQSGPELLDRIRTRQGAVPIQQVVTNLLGLLEAMIPPRAFYVRMLNKDLPEYGGVESFFRTVVDPVVEGFGYKPFEMGLGENEYAWMNQAIFDTLHHSQVVLVDVTGLRPNCFMELGYALGNKQRVLVTARAETQLPFDSSCIETFLWELDRGSGTLQNELKAYWNRNANRPPLVNPKGIG